MTRVFALLVSAAALAACGRPGSSRCSRPPVPQPVLSSDDFHDQGAMPAAITCDGEDRLPRLHWVGPPAGTRAFALRVTDPDAPGGVFHHWLAWNIPGSVHGLGPELPAGVRQADNDFSERGYRGPCPPPGPPHHYHFELIPLDAPLSAPDGAPRAVVERELAEHRIDDDCGYATEGRLVGVYRRASQPEQPPPRPIAPATAH